MKMTNENLEAKVLLAEDNRITQKMMGSLLAQWGHHVTIVSDGLEVLEKLKKSKYDVLILDFQMPNLDGLETFKAIQEIENPGIQRMPIILLTGEINPAVLEEIQSSGIKYYLRKPIQQEVLSATLAQLLQKSKTIRKKGTASTKYLRKIAKTDQGLMIEILNVFIEEAPKNIQRMKSYCLVEDWRSLKRLVHKVKANYAYVGMERQEGLLKRLEFDLEHNAYSETYLARVIQLEKITEEAVQALKRKRDNIHK